MQNGGKSIQPTGGRGLKISCRQTENWTYHKTKEDRYDVSDDGLLQKQNIKGQICVLMFSSFVVKGKGAMEYTFRAVTHSPGILIWRIEVI